MTFRPFDSRTGAENPPPETATLCCPLPLTSTLTRVIPSPRADPMTSTVPCGSTASATGATIDRQLFGASPDAGAAGRKIPPAADTTRIARNSPDQDVVARIPGTPSPSVLEKLLQGLLVELDRVRKVPFLLVGRSQPEVSLRGLRIQHRRLGEHLDGLVRLPLLQVDGPDADLGVLALRRELLRL